MIFDPLDTSMALREADLRLMYRHPLLEDEVVRKLGEDAGWVLLDELKKPGAGRRPEW